MLTLTFNFFFYILSYALYVAVNRLLAHLKYTSAFVQQETANKMLGQTGQKVS